MIVMVVHNAIFTKYGTIFSYTNKPSKYRLTWSNKPELKRYIADTVRSQLNMLRIKSTTLKFIRIFKLGS